MLRRLRKFIERVRRQEAGPSSRFRMALPPPPVTKSRLPYRNDHSGTAKDILHHLQYGPMTKAQLDEVLDVTTASIHLPLLVDRRLIRIIEGTWPFKYELVKPAQSVDAVDPSASDPGTPSTREKDSDD